MERAPGEPEGDVGVHELQALRGARALRGLRRTRPRCCPRCRSGGHRQRRRRTVRTTARCRRRESAGTPPRDCFVRAARDHHRYATDWSVVVHRDIRGRSPRWARRARRLPPRRPARGPSGARRRSTRFHFEQQVAVRAVGARRDTDRTRGCNRSPASTGPNPGTSPARCSRVVSTRPAGSPGTSLRRVPFDGLHPHLQPVTLGLAVIRG